ncbi:MAG TPA: hypothetical protein VHY08_18005 [Bacillota bacterium]|nr:hypothetical protein [Bacillota bacterium]
MTESKETPSKKHNCPDCRSCQWCSDNKCRVCLMSQPKPKKPAKNDFDQGRQD